MQVSASRELLFLGSSSFRQLPMLLSLRVCLSSKDTGYRARPHPSVLLGPKLLGGGGPVLDVLLPPGGRACGLWCKRRPVLCPLVGGGGGGGAGSLSSRHAHHAQVVGSR